MLANEYLYHSDADILIYPSAKTFHNYTNLAFHPNVAQRHLRFVKVLNFKIKDRHDDFGFKLSFKSVGRIENERVKWKKVAEEDVSDLGLIKQK